MSSYFLRRHFLVVLLLFLSVIVQVVHADELTTALSIENGTLVIKVSTHDGTISVTDKRNGKTWNQQAVPNEVYFDSGFVPPGSRDRIELDGGHVVTKAQMNSFKCVIALEGELPEFTVSLAGEGELTRQVRFPQPFVGGKDLIIPMNEGIRYPVDDPTITDMGLVAYGGHGISMPFWGLTDGEAGQMAIFETPNDARIQVERRNGSLCVAPWWDAQKGQLGYERRLRYIFFDHGGYVAMCKRYRSYAQKIGLFKTLDEKRRENPNVDLLIGAANVWYWNDKDCVAMAQEMIDAGITRMLWSNAQSPHVADLNKPGLLTGCYDLYQDIMNPAKYPDLRWIHHDWIPQAWPTQIVLDAKGQPVEGWKVETRDGALYPCGVLSDRFAPDYARARIKADLEKSPYSARFIDTTTASAWREDYSPDHPQTRSESRQWRMELLNVASHEFHLVTGSETGVDTAVPYVDYFEGMLSLTYYRLPDSGRNMQEIWTAPPPEKLTRFQTGAFYRLPLWELVYHDCVVAQWYWGDYDNKIPGLWDKRDLFNMLYGTVPMFMFDRAFWNEHKDRFVQSYRNTCPLARNVGYSEMVDHQWLTPDALVQQTRFANGVTVTVNFGTQPYVSKDNENIAPGNFSVTGLKDNPTPSP